MGLHNYATSVNLTALALADRDGRYKTVIARAADFLRKLQWDESEDKSPADPVYGGAGYGGGSRPDMSNTSFFLDALLMAGVPKSDPAFKKAVVYVSRSQNFKNEFNDQPWAARSTTAASSTQPAATPAATRSRTAASPATAA